MMSVNTLRVIRIIPLKILSRPLVTNGAEMDMPHTLQMSDIPSKQFS